MNHTEVEHRRLVVTLTKRGIWENRHVVYEECLKRKVGTAELNSAEIRKITNDLNSDEQWGWADFSNPMHRQIMSFCHQMQKEKMSDKLHRMVVDTEWLGRWLKHYSGPKKPLKKCNTEELGKIIKAMDDMVKNFHK